MSTCSGRRRSPRNTAGGRSPTSRRCCANAASRRSASARRTRSTPGRRSRRRRPASTCWSRSRWPPALEDCDAMLAAARRHGVKLGVISQRRWYEPVLRMKAAIDAGKIGRPVLGTFVMYSWRDPSYYRSDPWRGRWDTEGGGVLVNQSPHMLDLLAVAHGRRGRRGQRLLGQPQPSLRRGRGQRRGDPPVPQRRPRLDRHQPVAEAGHLHQGAHPWVERRVGRRRDRPRRDLHRRDVGDLRAAAQRPLDHPRRGRPARDVPGRGPRPVRDRSTR